jgi:hypothetical protein
MLYQCRAFKKTSRLQFFSLGCKCLRFIYLFEEESVTDLISNKGKANDFVAKLQSRNFPIFSPPGSNPTSTGARKITAATKTKLEAKKKAIREKKAQANKEKKLVVAACKLEAQAKKHEKAIALAEAHAQKATAKAEAL